MCDRYKLREPIYIQQKINRRSTDMTDTVSWEGSSALGSTYTSPPHEPHPQFNTDENARIISHILSEPTPASINEAKRRNISLAAPSPADRGIAPPSATGKAVPLFNRAVGDSSFTQNYAWVPPLVTFIAMFLAGLFIFENSWKVWQAPCSAYFNALVLALVTAIGAYVAALITQDAFGSDGDYCDTDQAGKRFGYSWMGAGFTAAGALVVLLLEQCAHKGDARFAKSPLKLGLYIVLAALIGLGATNFQNGVACQEGGAATGWMVGIVAVLTATGAVAADVK